MKGWILGCRAGRHDLAVGLDPHGERAGEVRVPINRGACEVRRRGPAGAEGTVQHSVGGEAGDAEQSHPIHTPADEPARHNLAVALDRDVLRVPEGPVRLPVEIETCVAKRHVECPAVLVACHQDEVPVASEGGAGVRGVPVIDVRLRAPDGHDLAALDHESGHPRLQDPERVEWIEGGHSKRSELLTIEVGGGPAVPAEVRVENSEAREARNEELHRGTRIHRIGVVDPSAPDHDGPVGLDRHRADGQVQAEVVAGDAVRTERRVERSTYLRKPIRQEARHRNGTGARQPCHHDLAVGLDGERSRAHGTRHSTESGVGASVCVVSPQHTLRMDDDDLRVDQRIHGRLKLHGDQTAAVLDDDLAGAASKPRVEKPARRHREQNALAGVHGDHDPSAWQDHQRHGPIVRVGIADVECGNSREGRSSCRVERHVEVAWRRAGEAHRDERQDDGEQADQAVHGHADHRPSPGNAQTLQREVGLFRSDAARYRRPGPLSRGGAEGTRGISAAAIRYSGDQWGVALKSPSTIPI